MTHVIDELVRTKKELDQAAKEAKTFFTNKDFSLDQRWDWFEALASADLLPNEIYGDGHISVLAKQGSLYDDFYIEKYETTNYADMYERIMEEEDDIYGQETIDAWREAVLAAGYGSFTYNW